MNDRRSGTHDEEAVIAAVQLLVGSMEPARREKLLALLLHGQQQEVVPDDAESEENVYPIQPLVLTTDEGQRASSDNRPASDAPQHAEEGSSERRRAGMLLERYAALPFASLPRARWWTRLAISAILLLVLFLSTLVTYELGVHEGAASAAAQASACQGQEYLIIRGRNGPFIHYPEGRVFVTDNAVQYGHPGRFVYYFADPDATWHIVRSHGFPGSVQCAAGPQIVFPSWHR
jgi:hypothetical protein